MIQKKNTTPVYYLNKPKSKKSAQKTSNKQPAQTPKVIHANRPTTKHSRQQIKIFFLKKNREPMKLRVGQNEML